jgi:hypothetical protein
MSIFLITVTQIADELQDDDDIMENPAGEYYWNADDEDKALNQFHANVPIGCLEDFDIHIEESDDPNRSGNKKSQTSGP